MRRLGITFFLLLAVHAFAQDLQQGLLLKYNFDGNTNDSSGNGYHGTPFALTYGTDRFGHPNSAAYFNGTNSYMNFPNLALLKPNLPVTFSFYVKYMSEDYHRQVVFNTSFEANRCTGVWFNSSLTNTAHAINYGNGAYSYSPATRQTFLCQKPIVTNVWYHLVVVVSSATDMKIYFDCENITQGVYSGYGESLVYSANPGCIGRHDRNLDDPTDYLEGYVDDFEYWNRALTSEEISQLCLMLPTDQFASASGKGLVLYPNPANDKLHIQSDLQNIQSFAVYNSLGQVMYSGDFLPEIDVAHFVPGLYFVTVKNDQTSLTRKILVGH